MELPTSARTAFLSLPKGLRSAILHRKGSYAPWETGRPPEAPPAQGLTRSHKPESRWQPAAAQAGGETRGSRNPVA